LLLGNDGSAAGNHCIDELSTTRTVGFERTANLPAGAWSVLIDNSQNLMRAMTVHVEIVSDP
jgi:hypothetical protein